MLPSKILIANRGEIAVRIASACAALGIRSVAVYSDADRTALHVRACDESYRIGPPSPTESYLRGDVIIEVARAAGCDAIHPGYGFLSENANFARAVQDAGLIWIGPSPEAIALLGSKIESKRLAERAGVAVVPGYYGDEQSDLALQRQAEQIGYPLLVKASAGGGGKGMRMVNDGHSLVEALAGARREAVSAFGDGSLLLERYLPDPRHIEVQVLGDKYGTIVHLGERECSIQRRYQKVIEESPSPAIDEHLREQITQSALALARAAAYSNAGTVEFIMQDGQYYFLEMNTRLQVEHPVTEEALDFDLVEAQIRIAAGEKLWVGQEELQFVGHAIEARLYAEDPQRGFLPSTGTVTRLEVPESEPDVRIDAGVTQGDTILPYYDPMIAKIITAGESRREALRRMREFLGGLELEGVQTNLDFLRWLFAHPQFEMGNLSTRFIEKYYRPGAFPIPPVQAILAGAAARLLRPASANSEKPSVWRASGWRQLRQEMHTTPMIDGQSYSVHMSSNGGTPGAWRATAAHDDQCLYEGELATDFGPGEPAGSLSEAEGGTLLLRMGEDAASHSIHYRYGMHAGELYINLDGREYVVRDAPPLSTDNLGRAVHLRDEDTLESPMPGKVLKLLVAQGQEVAEEEPLVIIEAMKMEFTVRAPHNGKVAAIHFREGEQVAVGDVLVELEK